MNSLVLDHEPTIRSVETEGGKLTVILDDDREISVPLAWYPRLSHATDEELRRYRILGGGYGIEWEMLDEHISINGLLAGRKSGESPSSLGNWLGGR